LKRIATILARAGSKGVKNKNIRSVGGKPLIAYSIEKALESEAFDAVAVSSDSDEILEIAEMFNATHLVKRPDELASDTAGKIPAIIHCVKEVERACSVKFDEVVDLAVTGPMREVEDILKAIEILEKNNASSVLSATETNRSPYFVMYEYDENGRLKKCKRTEKPLLRRQDAPKVYEVNGIVYVWNRDALFDKQTALYDDTKLYIMPHERAVDIDDELDLQFVEFLLARRKN